MSSIPTDAFVETLALAVAAMLVTLIATYATAKRVHRHNVIDVAWGLLFCCVAVASFVVSAGRGDDQRRWLLLAMTLVWGLRLAWHMAIRSRGHGEDPRYAKLLEGRGELGIILMVYVLQGVIAFIVAMPLVVGSLEDAPMGALAYVGVLVWVVGIVFEAVGDRQMAAYKADPDRGPVMDSGLWRFTRHPNYFGDACVWTGIFLITAEHWPGVLTIPSTALMIYLLAFGSGKRVLERHMAERPGYRAYMQRTSGFFPLPPRR
jgi:steroid 5-alpha reductase family enzyme